MPEVSFVNLLVIAAVAVLAPLGFVVLAEALGWRPSRTLGWQKSVAAGLLQATSLPFLVTADTIGVEVGTISATTGASLVCAGLLSVVLFPSLAVSQLRDRSADAGVAEVVKPNLTVTSPDGPAHS
jgi:hypothetical protein